MRARKGLKTLKFFQLWQTEFNPVLHSSICSSFGYHDGKKDGLGFIRYAKRPTEKEKDQWNKSNYKALIKLHKNFLKACKSSGILRRYLNKKEDRRDFNYVGEGRSEWDPEVEGIATEVVRITKEYNLFLDSYIQREVSRTKQQKSSSFRTRQRIPTQVSKEILRLLHYYSGDAAALESIRTFLGQGNVLDYQMQKSIRIVRTGALQLLEAEKRRLIESKKGNASDRKLSHRINQKIAFKNKEMEKVKKHKITWGLFQHRHSADTRWANHLKDHLIKLILSEGKPKIAKNLRGLKRQKANLLKELEMQNRRTASGS